MLWDIMRVMQYAVLENQGIEVNITTENTSNETEDGIVLINQFMELMLKLEQWLHLL